MDSYFACGGGGAGGGVEHAVPFACALYPVAAFKEASSPKFSALLAEPSNDFSPPEEELSACGSPPFPARLRASMFDVLRPNVVVEPS